MRVYNRGVIYYTFSYYIIRVYNGVIDHTPTVYIKLHFYIVLMGAILFGLFVIESGDVYLCSREYVHILLPFVFVFK